MATYVRKPLPIDKKKGKFWAMASLGSAGVGLAGIQLFDLVNRETYRAHRVGLTTGGISLGLPFGASFGASDYVNFTTPRDVNFLDFQGVRMVVRETNVGLYSWTTVSFWGLSVRIAGGGLNIPGLGVSGGDAEVLFSDGTALGEVDFILSQPPVTRVPGPTHEFGKEDDAGIRIPGDVLFGFDQFRLKPGKATEDALASMLNSMWWKSDRGFLIRGHTDSIGGDAYNKLLAKRRAETVAAWIKVRYPAWGPSIKTEGVGKSDPIAPNDTPENRAKNRRIEVWTLPMKYWKDY